MLAALVCAIRNYVGLEFIILRRRTVTVPRLKETEKYRDKDVGPYVSNYIWYAGSGYRWELKIIDRHTSIASMRHTVCLCDLRRQAMRMYERGGKGPLVSCWHRLSGTGRGRVKPGR